MPLFSVIIPTFNRDPSVALNSVAAQTYHDWECLVVDDGSTDAEPIKSAVAAMNDDRFRYIRRDNGGESAARNTGIDNATGEFVAFLDSDDEWLPGKLQWEAENARENRVLFSPVMMSRNGKLTGQRPRRGPDPSEDIPEYLFCHEGFISSSSTTVPTALARRVRWDEAVKFGADSAFTVRLSDAGIRFKMCDVPLAIVNDDESPDRQSRLVDWRTTKDWLDRIRPNISPRAYKSYLGWHIARQAAQSGQLFQALRLYFTGVWSMPNRLKAKAAIQVLVPRRIYKMLG